MRWLNLAEVLDLHRASFSRAHTRCLATTSRSKVWRWCSTPNRRVTYVKSRNVSLGFPPSLLTREWLAAWLDPVADRRGGSGLPIWFPL